MALFRDDTLQWSADPDAVSYEFQVVPVGQGPEGASTITSVPDHTTVPGSTANSIPADALFSANVQDGQNYDIHIRGKDSSGANGPWSDALTEQFFLSLVAKVTDLTVVPA